MNNAYTEIDTDLTLSVEGSTPVARGALQSAELDLADLDRARELIFEAQLMLANDRPYLCLFYKQTIDLARDNLIQGSWALRATCPAP